MPRVMSCWYLVRLILLLTAAGCWQPLAAYAVAPRAAPAPGPVPAAAPAEPAPWGYIPNRGQWPAVVALRADIAPGLVLFAEKSRLTWLRYDAAAHAANAHAASRGGAPQAVAAHAWAVEFVGAQAAAPPQAEGQPLPTRRHYFVGADPTRWAANVPATPAARYANLWPGIDLKLHAAASGAFEYDLELRPGADPARVGLRYRGLKNLRLDPATGNLRLQTALGELVEAAPVAWHPATATAARRALPCRFNLRREAGGATVVGFELPAGYDRARPLVLDPVLVFATYSGSTAPVFGHTATYDASGHLYAAGPCYGVGYPATLGAFDLTHSTNNTNTLNYDNPDVAISRYSPDGRRLLYATYLGGDRPEFPHSLLVNRQGELLVLGTTESADFPTTPGAYDRTVHGGADLFIAKFDSTGAQLRASTRLGGDGDDGRTPQALQFFYGDHFRGDLAVDSLDRVVIATATQSRNFPFTPGAVRPTAGFTSTSLVARLSADLTQLDWAAGLGFNAVAYSLSLTRAGSVYAVGTTFSAAFPTTAGTLAPADAGVTFSRQRDGFIAHLAADGKSLLAATYLRPVDVPNSALATQTFFVQPAPEGQGTDVFVLGSSTGRFPATTGTWGQPNGGLIIERLSGDLTRRRWTANVGRPVTTLGSSGVATDNISPTAFLVDACGQLYFSAWGTTLGLPTTPGAVSRQTDGQDLYLAVLDPNATGLHYATFLGGNSSNSFAEEHVDGGTSRFDPRGRVYQAVCTNAHNFPTTPGAWRRTCQVANNFYDEVAVKLDFEPRFVRAVAATISTSGSATNTFEAPASVQFTNQSSTFPGTTYQWNYGDGSPPDNAFAPLHFYPNPGVYLVTLITTDPGACGSVDTARLTITVLENDSTETRNYTICRGDSVQFANVGLVPGSFVWLPAAFLSDATVPDPWAAPLVTTVYEATGEPISTETATTWRVVVTVLPPDSLTLRSDRTCRPDGVAVALTLSSTIGSASWDFGDGTPPVAVTGSTNTINHFYAHQAGASAYTARVTGLDSHQCPATATTRIPAGAFFVPNIITPNGDSLNEYFHVSCIEPGTATLQIYNRWGTQVYASERNRYFNQWNGAGLPAGVYYYRLELLKPLVAYKGWVEIIR